MVAVDRLHARVRRPDPAVRARPALPRAGHGRLRPQRLPRASCAASSRSTATTSRSPRCSALADEGDGRAAAVQARRSSKYGIDTETARRPGRSEERGRWLIKDVVVPDIGDFADVPVIEMLVTPGDTVAAEDPLVTLESDKATMDVPSPFGGRGAGAEGQARRHGVARARVLLTLDAATARAPSGAPRRRPRSPRRRRRRRRPTRRRRDRRRGAAEAPTSRRRGPRARRAGGRRGRAGRRRRRPSAARASRDRLRRPGRRRLARELGVDLAPVRGQRPQGPDHQGGRRGRRKAARAAAPAAAAPAAPPRPAPAAGLGLTAVAEGRLREVRRGRARAADADQEDQRRRRCPATG